MYTKYCRRGLRGISIAILAISNVLFGPFFLSSTCSLSLNLNSAAIFLDPKEIRFCGLVENRTFDVTVNIANIHDLFGYEFKILWNTTFLDIVDIKVSPPETWSTNYFVAKNHVDHVNGTYWHVITAVPPSEGFSGNASLVTLKFKIIHIPLYPEIIRSEIRLIDTKLSDSDVNIIPHHIINAVFIYEPIKPQILLQPSTLKVNATDSNFQLQLILNNTVCLYGMYIKLVFNYSLLRIVDLKYHKFLQEPYRFQSVGFNQENGEIWIEIESKPPAKPVNGSGLILDIIFVFRTLPSSSVNSTVSFQESLLLTPMGETLKHESLNATILFYPIFGDLNSDGEVNVHDLYLIAMCYGCRRGDSHWNEKADLNSDGVIDIFDMVFLAKHFNAG